LKKISRRLSSRIKSFKCGFLMINIFNWKGDSNKQRKTRSNLILIKLISRSKSTIHITSYTWLISRLRSKGSKSFKPSNR
jgi:hypothetical protein